MGVLDRFKDAELSETVVVFVTAPSADEAARIARTLVEEKLAACGNVIPAIRSIYRWQGSIHDDQEALLVLKAPRKRLTELADRVAQIHPYELPEVVGVPIEGGSEKYVDWIIQSMY
jgi:periplasmic divalent cation tolerance protein